jgi:hypothetical protein
MPPLVNFLPLLTQAVSDAIISRARLRVDIILRLPLADMND